MTTLPPFHYHPDPLATGSLRPSTEPCCCCGQPRGLLYVGPMYTAQDVPGRVCPWCIADGSAARRFDAEFTDAGELTGLPDDVVEEVCSRTPAFSTWQQGRWLAHCADAAAFLGPVGIKELRAHPEALEMIRSEFADPRRQQHFLQSFLEALHAQGNPTAYLFRCRACGEHLAYADGT
ncbi:hypothetical protein C7C46_01605 [Streptomyces tateyamensis]|uniref:CbrC family protein n=1 Tax=Streptomyces tateyamensis TaxID=565073 RepID=A0A2V4NVZ6_9ACTN|nr:CbrC family protein [Streptomyces tateyamensis]PYC88074.1 hypothetical protein C7C46_01605 [Streptomyces tateyamensis]